MGKEYTFSLLHRQMFQQDSALKNEIILVCALQFNKVRYFEDLRQRGTWFISMFSTSPMLQEKPRAMLDRKAFNGGH